MRHATREAHENPARLILKGRDGALPPSTELAEAAEGLDSAGRVDTQPEMATPTLGLAILG